MRKNKSIIKNIKIKGNCPVCGLETIVMVTYVHYINGRCSHQYTIPICMDCGNDEIEVRQINHRRYKVI